MNIHARREIRQTAAQALTSAPGSPQKVALVYGGIVCLMSLASTVISFILNNQIAGTGGLSSMGLRSILSTIKAILPIAQVLIGLALELGYISAMLDVSRGRRTEPRSLLNGFYRFGPMLRSMLLLGLICFGVIFVAIYLSSWIFMLLPAYDDLYAVIGPLMESVTALDSTLAIDDATLAAAYEAMIPMMWIFAAVAIVLLLPVIYRYRMVTFCIADAEHPGALAALRESTSMMRRNRFALFRLDLGFWWYYLLQILVPVIGYGDLLLPMLGVTLPWSDTVSYFLFLVLSLALQMVIYGCFMNRVTVTYATAYETLRPKPQTGGVVLGNIFDLAKDYKE